MDAIGELANLLMVRMLVIRKRGVTTHLTWPSCILIYVNKLVNMQITAGRRFFANSRNYKQPYSYATTAMPAG